MRRPFASMLALAATAAAIPLASPAPAAADSVVIGGFPVEISESPWTVALSSRDRFGGTRAGQFCGGVVISASKVLTAAHCLGSDVLGPPSRRVRDLKVIAGRGDLLSSGGKEISVRDIWVNRATTPIRMPVTSACSRSPPRFPRARSSVWRRRETPRTSRVPPPRFMAGVTPRVGVTTPAVSGPRV